MIETLKLTAIFMPAIIGLKTVAITRGQGLRIKFL